MSTLVRRPLYRCLYDGDVVELAVPPVQNEALEGVITRVVDLELKDEPDLATNVPVEIHLVERIASTLVKQFKGISNKISGQSYPNRAVVPCVGPLARLRRVPTHDHDLTGMTDGEAWMHIADACDVTYDPDDIVDAGYEIGAIRPIYWLTDQAGQEMIAELDRVFGTATIEIGDGRVIRFAYDRAPDAANIGTTYTRGTDVEFWQNQRDRGDLDAIVNVWAVTGLSWSTPTDEGGDGCQRTVWARGEGDNDVLGAGVRNRAGSFQSDIIQDTNLAEAIAERMMRWYNRQPDTLTVAALNDPNVNCGSVIGVKDEAYAIDLTVSADDTAWLVLTIDRRGDEMTLNCVGDDPGNVGTITSGIEKVCNATSTATFDSPPVFTPPTITVPPSVGSGDDPDPDPVPPATVGEVCGVADDTNFAGSDFWVFTDGDWVIDPDTGAMSASGAAAGAMFMAIPIDPADSWELEMVFTADFTSAIAGYGNVGLSVGQSPTDVDRLLISHVFDQVAPSSDNAYVGTNNSSHCIDVGVCNTEAYSYPMVMPLNTDITFTLSYDALTHICSGTSSEAGTNTPGAYTYWSSMPSPLYISITSTFQAAIVQPLLTVKSVKVLSASPGVICV